MNISKNFTLEELTKTATNFPNNPPSEAIDRLLYLATYLLQPIRNKYGAIEITSGYRSIKVNQFIGGAPESQHLRGEAADIVPVEANIDIVFEWIVKELNFGQAIRENKNGKDWIHISLPRISKPNQQTLIYENGVYGLYEPKR